MHTNNLYYLDFKILFYIYGILFVLFICIAQKTFDKQTAGKFDTNGF